MNPLLLAFFGGALILGSATVHRFEREAAAEIKSNVHGANARVSVRTHLDLQSLKGDFPSVTIHASNFEADGLPLYTEPMLSKKGRVRRVNLDLREFRLRGLLVDSLQAQIRDCRFDLDLALTHHKFRLSRSGMGPAVVTLRPKDLEAFILYKFHEIKEVHVEISDGRIKVSGFGQFLVFDTHFEVVSTLEPRGNAQIFLSDATVTFDGQPAEPASAKILLDVLNPIVDLDQDLNLEHAVKLEKVELRGGKLIASGTVSIPAKRNAATK